MKKKINISPSQIEKLVKRVIKEEAGKDTPGGNPEYFYDDEWKKMRDGGSEKEEIEVESSEENDIIKTIPYKDGQLVLEYDTVFGPPKYVIYFESGDLEGGDTTSDVVADLDPNFFDEQMSTTILEYIKTRE